MFLKMFARCCESFIMKITCECMWVRQGLIHGMLMRSLGSFLRCDDTLLQPGSGK